MLASGGYDVCMDIVDYTADRRRKDDGYDRNFTNTTANIRVSIAISRLTAPIVSSLFRTTRPATVCDVVCQFDDGTRGRRGRVYGVGIEMWKLRLQSVGELVMLNAAQRNRRYRTLRTLQLTKQITLNQRTPIPDTDIVILSRDSSNETFSTQFSLLTPLGNCEYALCPFRELYSDKFRLLLYSIEETHG